MMEMTDVQFIRMPTADELPRLRKLRHARSKVVERLYSARSRVTATTRGANSCNVRSSRNARSREDMVLKLIGVQHELARLDLEIHQTWLAMEIFIADIPDPRDRIILKMRHIHGWELSQIARRLRDSTASVTKRDSRLIAELKTREEVETRKTIQIINSHGDTIGRYRFDPDTPMVYAERLAKHPFPAIGSDFSTHADGSCAAAVDAKAHADAEQKVLRWFDDLLGYTNAGAEIFGTVRPFAKIGGKFFAEQVVESLNTTLTASIHRKVRR